MGWLVALVGSIITDMRGGDFNRFYWWALAYTLCCIIGVTTVILSATQDQYAIGVCPARRRCCTVGPLTAAYRSWASWVSPPPTIPLPSPPWFSLATPSKKLPPLDTSSCPLSRYVHPSRRLPPRPVLTSSQLLWIGYFGSSAQAKHRGYIDSFALSKEQRASMRGSRSMSAHNYGRPDTTASGPAPQMYTSAQLNGFETSSPVSGYHGGPVGAADRGGIQQRFGAPAGQSAPRSPTMAQQPQAGLGGAEPGNPAGEPGVAPAEYPYRAKAIYSYEANPDDANEISFQKHEILDVSDVSGRWWQARKENGDTGIAPSNYLILL